MVKNVEARKFYLVNLRWTGKGCRQKLELKPPNLRYKRVIFETGLMKTSGYRESYKH